jgi:hypothetical protein
MNAYMNKYAEKYTYICICDSLIIDKFGSLLQFGKNRTLYEAYCSSSNRDYVSQLRSANGKK